MFEDKYVVNNSKVFDGKTTLLLKLYLTIPTVVSHMICFLYGIFCKMTLNTRPTIESKRSEDNCFNITIKTDKSSIIYIVTSIITSDGYNFRFRVSMHHRYPNGNSLENQNNEKNNFHTEFQLYLNIVNHEKQTLNLQKIKKSVYRIYEWKNKFTLSPHHSQSDEGTNIKYYNEDDPINNTNSNDENSASYNHSPKYRRSKIKTNRTKQQNNRNTWKPLLIVSVDYIVRQSVEGYLSSKRQYEERPMVHWPSMHPLLLFKNRHLDDDNISN